MAKGDDIRSEWETAKITLAVLVGNNGPYSNFKPNETQEIIDAITDPSAADLM
ncbi:hypothetical protein M3221_24730 [Domibacillus indicus]|uniref:hypothetical protein n=1 Tax=Domibacillus indicus TaxID=1437523 RepID=UPI00203A9C42|nr:hypothetical protein [Domibacillus indicus]MCM3791532.1 hypothetical protein [Domibacillus indicus]